MDAHAFEPRRLGHGGPRPLQINARLPGLLARNDEGVALDTRKRREDSRMIFAAVISPLRAAVRTAATIFLILISLPPSSS
jgi:hypothetical protein